MRRLGMLAASALLVSCGGTTEQPPVEAAAGAITYDGADYGDDPAAKLAHGERLTRVLGCKGCHGDNLQGQNFTADAPEWGDHYAKNLTLLIGSYSDAELDQAIRHGKPKDGRAMVFMPSEMFEPLADEDFDALVAYLRTLKPAGEPVPQSRIGPKVAEWAQANKLDLSKSFHEQWKGRGPVDLGPRHAQARYIARTACTECHSIELEGYVDFSPDLDIAAMYDAPEFAKLLKTGEGKTKPHLGLMTWAAQTRFAHLTDAEVAALHAYLKARAEAKPPE